MIHERSAPRREGTAVLNRCAERSVGTPALDSSSVRSASAAMLRG